MLIVYTVGDPVGKMSSDDSNIIRRHVSVVDIRIRRDTTFRPEILTVQAIKKFVSFDAVAGVGWSSQHSHKSRSSGSEESLHDGKVRAEVCVQLSQQRCRKEWWFALFLKHLFGGRGSSYKLRRRAALSTKDIVNNKLIIIPNCLPRKNLPEASA